VQAIHNSNAVPKASFVLTSSPDKFQVVWKAEGVTLEEAEALVWTAGSGDMYFKVPRPCCHPLRVLEAAVAKKSPHFVTPKSPNLTIEGMLSAVAEERNHCCPVKD
jgi:hypothetical protein